MGANNGKQYGSEGKSWNYYFIKTRFTPGPVFINCTALHFYVSAVSDFYEFVSKDAEQTVGNGAVIKLQLISDSG